MAREKRFRTSFMGGFKKSDVNAYIERILKEFDEKLKSKDDEISVLRNQNMNLKFRYDELLKKSDEINETRAKIGDVLTQARKRPKRCWSKHSSKLLRRERGSRRPLSRKEKNWSISGRT